MALYIGDTLISGEIEGQKLNLPFTLFEFQFTDHILNNASWLRADTFSWASGAVYVSAYEHLVDDIDNITAETETIAGYTVTFYRATDGHKICLADQESTVADIFTATGVAWYYILDTANQRFKLPRTKYEFVGLRDVVGKYVPESLPNITGEAGITNGYGLLNNDLGENISGAFTKGANKSGGINGSTFSTCTNLKVNASLSSSAYQDNAPVQQRATQMYLYFYVGETIQNANLINAGAVLDALDNKVDIDLNNCTKPYITETYVNGSSWYRVYSDGWCEQGGIINVNYAQKISTVTFLKPYVDTNYNVLLSMGGFTANGVGNCSWQNKTTTTFEIYGDYTNSTSLNVPTTWQACGYIS